MPEAGPTPSLAVHDYRRADRSALIRQCCQARSQPPATLQLPTAGGGEAQQQGERRQEGGGQRGGRVQGQAGGQGEGQGQGQALEGCRRR